MIILVISSRLISIHDFLSSLYVCFSLQNGVDLGVMWGKEKALELLKNAVFTIISANTLKHDFKNYYFMFAKKLIPLK